MASCLTVDSDHISLIWLCGTLGTYWSDTPGLQYGCAPEGSFHCRKLIPCNRLMDPAVPADLEDLEGREDLGTQSLEKIQFNIIGILL